VIINREDIEAAGAIGDVALGEEALRGAGDHALLVGGDAEFGRAVSSSRNVRVRTSTKASVPPS
jgi:hypothetical protein